MKRVNLFFAFVSMLAWLPPAFLFADDLSARRYGGFAHLEWVDKFYLLATPEVQTALALSREQFSAIKAIFNTRPKEIPGGKSVLEVAVGQLGTCSTVQAASVRSESRGKITELYSAFASNELAKILNPNQLIRLDQLYFQMRGPGILLERADLAQACEISAVQLKDMKAAATAFERVLEVLKNRRIELEINPLRPDREPAGVAKEIECIDLIICEVEKDRDHILLGMMNVEQLALWNRIVGELLPIDWKIEGVFDRPF
jgi:hypothetical protein